MSPPRQEFKVGWKGVWEQQASASSAVGGFIVPLAPPLSVTTSARASGQPQPPWS